MVKKLNLRTGIPFSLLISVIAVLLRLIRIESVHIGIYITLVTTYFFYSLLCWVCNILLINSSLALSFSRKQGRFSIYTTLLGISLSLLFAAINMAMKGNILTVSEFHAIDDKKLSIVFFLRGMMIHLFNAFLVSHSKQRELHEARQLELERLKQANLQASLSSLKEQLSPHFLFNSLNTLSSLSHEQEVKDYVDQMANVYRYLLDHQQNNLVEIRQELAFVKAYLYIMQTRLESALEVDIRIEERVLQSKIPTLSLQLLIENAIRHNIASAAKPLKIDIYTCNEELVITNVLQERASMASSPGIGLFNIDQRYRLLLGKEISIEKDQHLFTVKLPLQ